jgi:hypothetical protein
VRSIIAMETKISATIEIEAEDFVLEIQRVVTLL